MHAQRALSHVHPLRVEKMRKEMKRATEVVSKHAQIVDDHVTVESVRMKTEVTMKIMPRLVEILFAGS